MRQRDWRGEREGRTNDSRSFDKVACAAEIVFSCQVCVFIVEIEIEIEIEIRNLYNIS
jgi:hypothetical protein